MKRITTDLLEIFSMVVVINKYLRNDKTNKFCASSLMRDLFSFTNEISEMAWKTF